MRYLLVLALSLAACTEQPPPAPAPDAEGDSVLALLRSADTAALDDAFARLQAHPEYRVTTTTEQFDPDGEPVASHSRTYRVTPRSAEVIAADSSGTFEYGGFERFAERRARPSFAESAASLVLPADPAYLDPQGREAFAFESAGDTLLSDQRVRILTVRALPGEGDDQPLRIARLYLDAAGALVGARVERRQASVLFGEASTRTIFLRPTDGGWLPDRLTVDAEIRAPLAAPRRLRLDERYAFDG